MLDAMARELMEMLDTKYNMKNKLSLDDYLYDYKSILEPSDILKINNLLNKYNY